VSSERPARHLVARARLTFDFMWNYAIIPVSAKMNCTGLFFVRACAIKSRIAGDKPVFILADAQALAIRDFAFMRKQSERRIAPDGTIEKRCTKCGLWHPDTAIFFFTHKDKTSQPCRACEVERVRRYEIEHPDKAREAKRRWAINNPEKIRKSQNQWAINNPEKRRRSSRRYAANNRDKIKETSHRYYLKHPDVYTTATQRRNARKRQLPHTFSTKDWRACVAYFNGCCAVCGKPTGLWHTLARDHWIPLSDPSCPGTVAVNIVPLCHAMRDGEEGCNNSKLNRDPVEWLTEKLGPRKAKCKLAEIRAYFDSVKEQHGEQ
jgi:hypothetical protein